MDIVNISKKRNAFLHCQQTCSRLHAVNSITFLHTHTTEFTPITGSRHAEIPTRFTFLHSLTACILHLWINEAQWAPFVPLAEAHCSLPDCQIHLMPLGDLSLCLVSPHTLHCSSTYPDWLLRIVYNIVCK